MRHRESTGRVGCEWKWCWAAQHEGVLLVRRAGFACEAHLAAPALPSSNPPSHPPTPVLPPHAYLLEAGHQLLIGFALPGQEAQVRHHVAVDAPLGVDDQHQAIPARRARRAGRAAALMSGPGHPWAPKGHEGSDAVHSLALLTTHSFIHSCPLKVGAAVPAAAAVPRACRELAICGAGCPAVAA